VTNHFRSLRVTSTFLVGAAFLTGLASTWIWMQSNADWRAHQEAAFLSGVTVYNALLNGTSASSGVTLQPLSPADAALAAKGQFGQLSGAPRGARITNVPIRADAAATVMGEALLMVIVSPEITYKLADLPRRDNQTAAETTGTVFRLIASFCSDPLVIARKGGGDWIRIEGASVWGCGVAPPDHRLPAAILGIVMMAGLLTVALNISAEFTQFAEQLRSRRRLGGPTRYAIEGPRELQDIVSAVNSYLEAERDQLESRAAVLSGVSHDLGTPATRLRLRTALIRDETLRRKFDADIDRMTGMIESVLTYTRAEMSVEDPRKLSLKSLVEAVGGARTRAHEPDRQCAEIRAARDGLPRSRRDMGDGSGRGLRVGEFRRRDRSPDRALQAR
jgi:hypothetical protein